MPSPPGHVSKEAIAEARRAIEDGNEDRIGLEQIDPRPPICEATSPGSIYVKAHRCPYRARFKTRGGNQFCQIHAELWAATSDDAR